MKTIKNEQHIVKSDKEADFDKIGHIVAGMTTPELPDIETEWIAFEERIDQKANNKRISLFTKNRIIAASVACFILLLFGLFGYLNFKEIKYITANNKHTVKLRDGSQIVMNNNSSIRYKAGYGILNRKIELSGEAFFKVKKGVNPFIVNTSIAEIKVTGTHFNVKARKNRTEVGVSEGRVEFSSANKNGPAVILTKGFFSSCIENDLPSQAKAVQYPGYPGWMHDQLIYRGSPVKEIIADIEDLFNIKIKVSDIQILNLEVTGIIEGKNPQDVLQTLGLLIGKKFRFNNNTYEMY